MTKLILCILCTITFSYSITLTEKEKKFLENHSTIYIGTDNTWYPHTYITHDDKLLTLYTNIINEINRETGANFQLKLGKWNDLIKQAKTKNIDGLIPSINHKNRGNFFNFSKPFISLDVFIVVKKGNPLKINSEKDLNNKTFVLLKGSLFKEEIIKRYYNPNIVYKDSISEVYKEIASGIGDIAIQDAPTYLMNNKYGLPYLNVAFKLQDKADLVVSIRKDWPEAISIINKGIDAVLRKDKNFINLKWFSENTDKISNHDNLLLNEEELKYTLQKKQIKICADPTWHTFYNSTLKEIDNNLTIKFLDIVLNKVGLNRKIVLTQTWEESLKFLKNKKCDLIAAIQNNNERSNYITFTSPYTYYSTTIVTSNDTPYLYNLDLLKNKKIVMLKKHAAIKAFKKKYPSSKIIYTNNVNEAINMVKNKDVFGYVELIPVLVPLINSEEKIKINRELDFGLSLSMGISKDNDLLHSIIEKTLLSIPSIERSKIFNKIISTTYQKKADYSLVWKILSIIVIAFLIVLFWNKKLKENINAAILKNKEQESLLYHYSKQDAMKDLVGNITHQWKQPIDELSSLLFYIETKNLLNERVTDNELVQIIDNGRAIIDFLSNTVDTFSTFYDTKTESSMIELKQLIKKTLFVINGTFELNRIKVNINIENKNFKIKGSGLEQVFLALLNNVKNISNKRKIENKLVEIKVYEYKKSLLIEINDNCGGIKENINSIFELGKSNIEKGRGLGLYISRKIIEDMYNGDISVQNLNDGASFRIKIHKNYYTIETD